MGRGAKLVSRSVGGLTLNAFNKKGVFNLNNNVFTLMLGFRLNLRL